MSNDIAFSVGVVLPAAGCGERMKLPTPKQFCEVNGRPLICYTIDSFHRLPWIQDVVISTSAGHIELLQALVSKYNFHKVTVVQGGTTRHRSIHAGVKSLLKVAPNTEVVVIHDAVRPFVSSEILGEIVMAAYTYGAAGVCRPLVSTVIARGPDQQLTESLDRSRYFNSEMPQAFRAQVISGAYDQCTQDDFDYGTECLLLAMKYSGVKAKILDGGSDLWKVTYRKDLFSAEAVIKERMTKVEIINRECWPELEDSLTEHLHSCHIQVTQSSHLESAAGDKPARDSTANTFIILHSHLCLSPHTSTADRESTSRNTDHNPSINQNSTTSQSPSDVDVSGSSLNRYQEISSARKPEQVEGGLLKRLASVQDRCLPGSSACQLMDSTFVHVFVAGSEVEGLEVQTGLSRAVLDLSRTYREKSVLVYGVLTTREMKVEEVGQMIISIIQRGHQHFSGQLFLVVPGQGKMLAS